MKSVSASIGSRVAYVTFTPANWIVMIVFIAALSLFSMNAYLTFAALVCLPLFASSLWRIGEPPILFFAVSFQWLQASAKIFDANIRGLTLQDYYVGWRIDDAIWLNLIGLVVLSIGTRVSLRHFDRDKSIDLAREVASMSIQKIWYAYLAFVLFSLLAQNYIWIFPRLSQIMLALLNFKWVLFFLLAMVVLGQRQKLQWLLLAILIELLIGFTGFFAGFKQVFFVLVLVYLTYIKVYTKKVILLSLLAVIVLGYMMVIWSAVKTEYRDYVNLGTGKQRVLVNVEERLDKIVELYTSVDAEMFYTGIESLAKRVAYVDYFARVLERVPGNVPHEEGKLWGSAIGHVIQPRLFFPDKSVLLSDTVFTEKYTGYQLIRQGGRDTTVPLGYMTESYIDFGPVYMYVPIFLIGFLWGLMYRYFLGTSTEVVFGYGIAVAVLINANQLEISATKLVGAILMGFIAMALLQKLFVPTVHKAFRVDEKPV